MKKGWRHFDERDNWSLASKSYLSSLEPLFRSVKGNSADRYCCPDILFPSIQEGLLNPPKTTNSERMDRFVMHSPKPVTLGVGLVGHIDSSSTKHTSCVLARPLNEETTHPTDPGFYFGIWEEVIRSPVQDIKQTSKPRNLCGPENPKFFGPRSSSLSK